VYLSLRQDLLREHSGFGLRPNPPVTVRTANCGSQTLSDWDMRQKTRRFDPMDEFATSRWVHLRNPVEGKRDYRLKLNTLLL
jgi:hypothetical protein